MTLLRCLLYFAIVLIGVTRADSAYAKRVALLIANQNYAAEVGRLKTPASDVRLIAKSLEEIGFARSDIRIVTEADRAAMLDALVEHARALKAAGPEAVGLIYYSGHGVANKLNRQNYLIPVDVEKLDADMWNKSVPITRIASTLAHMAKDVAHFLVFDACRPLPNIPANGGDGCIPLTARHGMLIAFSTEPGQTVSDAASDSSVYAKALAVELVKPNLDHFTMFKNVSEAVHTRFKSQSPWTRDGLRRRHYFGGKTTASLDGGQVPLAPAERGPEVSASTPPGTRFRDCSVCPEMVVVPAGSFTMGSPEAEPGSKANEGPQQEVTIKTPLAVGRFEVMFSEWDACVAEWGCTHRPDDERWGRGRRPVVNVSWHDIKNQFLPWLSKKTGATYRLLSEAEWEYVARAGSTSPFWWGKAISPNQANYDGSHVYEGGGSKGEYRGRTVLVDSFKPNPWGLYNVHGNVWEWTEDCWNDSHRGNPGDGRARETGICSRRVVRGGALFLAPRTLRSAHRFWLSSDIRYNDYGFRIAKTLAP